jgi:Alpha/beta hydrolase family
MKVMCLVAATAIAACTSQAPDANNGAPAAQSVVQVKRDYALINGLKMYFEIHGSGGPLVLLHGGFGVAESWAPMLPALTKSRQVVIVEQQGHGRTADRDGPLTYSQMVEDTSALLRELKISAATFLVIATAGSSQWVSPFARPTWCADWQYTARTPAA